MITWQDDGIVLSARPHGETAAVVSVLTRAHGRHAGAVPGGQSRSRAALLQPGQRVLATWRARLADQLGTYTLESSGGWPVALLDDPAALGALASACALTDAALPERAPYPRIHEGLQALIVTLGASGGAWSYAYVRWEIGLLAELGYGLDLGACAVTGSTRNLSHVSPRTGRAVCADVAAPHRERLLPLPAFLGGEGETAEEGVGDVQRGLALTGFFLARHIFAPHGAPLPSARVRLANRLRVA